MATLENGYCERFDVDVSDDICHKCKIDPVFKNKLLEKKIKNLERQYQISNATGTDYYKRCKYAAKTKQALRRCCHGKTKEYTLIMCALRRVWTYEFKCKLCWREL